MYRHVLVAIDGSPFSFKAAEHGLGLAKTIGAKATAIYVTPTWRALALSEIAVGHVEQQFDAQMKQTAETYFAQLRDIAGKLGLTCESVHVVGDYPYECIIETAAQRDCDVVVVGSHGRRGMASLLLGSETTKLLTHSKIPVIVYRA